MGDGLASILRRQDERAHRRRIVRDMTDHPDSLHTSDSDSLERVMTELNRTIRHVSKAYDHDQGCGGEEKMSEEIENARERLQFAEAFLDAADPNSDL